MKNEVLGLQSGSVLSLTIEEGGVEVLSGFDFRYEEGGR